ncbi:MAG: hypothetical protein ACRDL6_08475 [Solirubrobacterales bacterium]
MRATDRVIGIVLGILLGLAIVIGFVFFGSRDAIDDPSISGGGTPTQTQPAPQREQPPALTDPEPAP